MKIIIAGDFCPQNRVAEIFEQGNYGEVLGEVKDIISDADYSIVNFESPVTVGIEKPITKCGPTLQCSLKCVEAIKWAGFECVTLANNHFLDYGKKGAELTLKACEKYGIDTVGGGKNLQEASKVLYKKIDGKTLAVINCCEHEFSIATDETAGSNPLNPIQQYYAIQEAKKKADYVIVIVHGGHEMWQLPSPRMQEAYRFFVDAGADAVVNHHQHCYSGYEFYKGKPIIYGLGNFCFDNPNYYVGLWEYGYIVSLSFGTDVAFKLIPYEQCKKKPTIIITKNPSSFENHIKKLNAIIADSERLSEETARYFPRATKNIRLAFEPYNGRLLCKLFRIGLIPKLMTKTKLLKLQNIITCEAHRDKTIYALKHFKS